MLENEGHLSIKRDPFANPTSLLRRLIAQDSRDELKRVLEMGGSERNTALPNSQQLRSEQGDDGVYALLKLAIVHDAVSCFDLIIRWADADADADAAPRQEPNKPRYDLERVYRAARRAALRDGRLRCLLYLHDRDRKRHGGGVGSGVLGDPAELYATLLERARSPAAVVWLARRLPPASPASSSPSGGTATATATVADYGEILAAQCADPYAQPAVVEMLVGLVVPPGRRRGKEEEDDDDDDKEEVGNGCPALSLALCAAAGALRVSVMEVLLRYRPRAFAAVAELGVDTAAECGENPLLCALAHPLPGKPEPPVPIDSLAIDGGDEDETARAEEDTASELGGVEEDDEEAVVAELKKKWTTETRHVATAMHVVVRRLVELARVELRAPECQQLLADMLNQAAMVYAFCLREFLLRNLPWLLAYHHMLRVSLLTPNKSRASTVARNATACGEDALYTDEEIHGNPERREPGVEQEVTFTWVKGLDPKWARGALECCLVGSMQDLVKVWNLLVTPTTADAAEKYLGVRLKSLGGHDPVELLWGLLLSEGETSSPLFSPQILT
ncbi:hypothetical protein VTG60DRAFT_3085 [Thermothelomyces hinnuleus]